MPSIRLGRSEVLLGLGLVAVCLVCALLAGAGVEPRYTASTAYEITSDFEDPELPASVEGQRADVTAALDAPEDAIGVSVRSGDPRVTVRTTMPSRDEAIALANLVTAELVARDRGVDRELAFRRLRKVQRKLNRSDLKRARRERLQERRDRLTDSQVTDANFSAARSALRTGGPDQLRNVLVALPLGLLLSAAAISAQRWDGRRRAASTAPPSPR